MPKAATADICFHTNANASGVRVDRTESKWFHCFAQRYSQASLNHRAPESCSTSVELGLPTGELKNIESPNRTIACTCACSAS